MWRGQGVWTIVHVLALVVAQVALASLDTVLIVRFEQSMSFFAFLVNQTLYPLAFVLVCWPIVWALMAASRWGWLGSVADDPERGEYLVLESENRPASWLRGPLVQTRALLPKFAAVAALDGLAGLLGFLPMVFLGSELQVVLGQVGLPATLFFSWLYLGRRYYATHLWGVATVIFGVCVALVPTLDQPSVTALPVWIVLTALRTLPSAFSRVFQERWLSAYDLNPVYLLAWTSLFQLCVSILMLPLPLLPLPSPFPHVPTDAVKPFLVDAWSCFVGNLAVPARVASTYASSPALVRALEGASCGGGGHMAPVVLFGIFIVVNILMNAVSLALIKATTANLTAVTSVSRIGVAALLFTWPWLAGEAFRKLERHIVLGLVGVVLGILIFKSRSERPPPDNDDDVELAPLGVDEGGIRAVEKLLEKNKLT